MLLVEDDAIVSLYLQDLIEDLGYRVVGPVSDADNALELTSGDRPDIAVVDVSLAGAKDGIQLAGELASVYGTAIIFLSGHDYIAGREEVQRIKPAAILQKPCFPEALESALAHASAISRPATDEITAAASPPRHSE